MELIKKLFTFDRQLIGRGYDSALAELKTVLPLNIMDFKSGTQFGTWTVPNEWIVKEAWVKKDGVKIIDYKDNPLALMQYSAPFKGLIPKSEFIKHIQYSDEMPDALPYQFSFYEPKWGFSVKKEFVFKLIPDPNCDPEKMVCPPVHNATETIEDGEYEVFIDTQFVPGTMKIGVHTIKGESDREILIFAHLDHPWQANDNLSSVYAAIELAKKMKPLESTKLSEIVFREPPKHTIKIIFCPETIGSIAYAHTQDISKVDFVIALECVGTENPFMVQKSFNRNARINFAAHLALHEAGITYSKGDFRKTIGSDEYAFNDPLVGIPGILVSRFLDESQQPYKQYHTSADTPEIISDKAIQETVNYILRVIEIYEQDYIPVRKEKGVLMRSHFGLQTPHKINNWEMDMLWNDFANNTKYLSEIAKDYSMSWRQIYEFCKVLKDNGLIHEGNSGLDARQKRVKKVAK